MSLEAQMIKALAETAPLWSVPFSDGQYSNDRGRVSKTRPKKKKTHGKNKRK